MKKPRVNDPCPCGSGKKYKKCCRDRPVASPETLFEKIAAGKIPFGARIINDSGEVSSMELHGASVTRDGVTTVLIEDKLVISTNTTPGDPTKRAAATLSVPIDGTSPGTITTHGNASVANSQKAPGIAIAGGKKKLKASKDGFFVVVCIQVQRNTGLPFVQVFFGREGQSEAPDASGVKPRPHVEFHPDGNGKFIRIGGHDCEIEGHMEYLAAARTVRPQVVRVRSVELSVTAEIIFSTESPDTYLVKEIRFV
jgi:hypothetical protein